MNDEGGGQDERKLTLREKNREAVRNCRKRKKEMAKQLKDRVEELLEENAKLRLELQLGGDESGEKQAKLPQPIADKEEQELIEEMVDIVTQAREEEMATGAGPDQTSNKRPLSMTAPPRSDNEMALRRKIQVYMERHQDHGRDRQKAMAFILGRLQRLVEPETITKQYLKLMTSSTGPTENAEWRGLLQELQLTPEQMGEFQGRRRYAKRLRTELDCAFDKMKSIVDRCRRNKKVGDSLNELTSILKPEQFARFVVWVQTNPACKDILDELWSKLMSKCDVQINKEIYSDPLSVQQIKRFQENSAALSIRLFSIADSRSREAISKLCVHPDVVLVDANNNVDKRGIRAVTRYMSYISTAFDTQSCPKTKAQRALNVEEKSIVSDQQDDKVTGSWRLSGVYIGRLRPRKKHSSSPNSGASSPKTPFGPDASSLNVVGGGFTLPSSITTKLSSSSSSSSATSAKQPIVAPGSGLSPYLGNEIPEPLLTPEEQKERTVTFNVIVEFSFADPVRPELITEMIISWDAMSLVNQLGLLKSPVRGVLPPPNLTQPAAPVAAPSPSSAAAAATAKATVTEESLEKQGQEAAKNEAQVVAPSQAAKERALKLADVFMLHEHSERELLAVQLLDPKCIFDDIHMGAKYRGVTECLGYIRRLRAAFPKFDIAVSLLSQTKKEVSTRTRSKSESSVSAPELFEISWKVSGFYAGALVQEKKPCKIGGKVFITSNPANQMILSVKIDLPAQDLMYQLGILKN